MTPRDVFQIADRYCDSALLHHAHARGVFDMLGTAQTAAEIATAMGGVLWKTTIFLDALVALGLLEKISDRYRNSIASADALVRGSPGYIGDLIEHERLQWNLWSRMGDVLSSEHAVQGQQDLALPTDAYANAVFHRAMMQLAGELVDPVVTLPEWEGACHVLDLAGGHGRYLGELARRRPGMTGEVWDAPSARPHAEAALNSLGVADRVHFIERDISDPAGYTGVVADGVMLNHCLHHFSLDALDRIISCVSNLLPSGGVVVVLDVHLEPTRTGPAENAMFSLYMMMNTVDGRVHPTDEVARVLGRWGFQVKIQPIGSLEGDYIMVGRKR